MSESCVYIQDKDHGWLPAHVLSQTDDQVQVKVFDVDESAPSLGERTISLKDYPSNALPLQNVDASGKLLEMADMVDLPSLHEAAILYNLRKRHLESKPYTRVGDLIVAVNPFQWNKELYSQSVRNQYVDKLIWNVNTSGGDARAELPPHVYETSSMAFRGLAAQGQHQSILVSGESGAGKTETVKIVMSHLASVTLSFTETQEKQEQDSAHHLVVQRVLDSHPLLEAFGNAKTVRNDNSSRFGKFIQLQFDVEDATTAAYAGRAVPNCILAGSTCETYLLEKSRVVGHSPEERTYHVFYQLLAAPNSVKQKFWKGLVNTTNESFRHVGTTSTTTIEGKTDAQRWETTVQALELLNIKDEKLTTLMRAVCVVLQLGNLTFEAHLEDEEKSIISSKQELTALGELMGIPEEALEKALLFRTVVAGKETYTVPLSVQRARDGCDAFAKEIYQQAFDWLVRQVNMVTSAEENYKDAGDVEEYGKIGLLDIFGFESFEVNRFEQLCINYTNEKLQQKYTLDIFCSVQEEYAQEGIELGEISFDDNAEVLRLMEGRVGIISVLNEECVRPNGSDTGFVSKIKSVNSETAYLVSEKLHKPTEFAIQHYAGQVTYDATNFVQKNTDTLPRDVVDVACMSSNTLIQVEIKAAAESKMSSDKGEASKRPATRGAANHTVTSKFKHQLSHLMHAITKTKTRYIRCIKPNPEKLPLKMNMGTSAEQLRCAGVVAAVTISRVAFPNRLMHETALERFACLERVDADQIVDEKKEETDTDATGLREPVSALLTNLLKELETEGEDGSITKAFEIGNSRVYFRTGALEFLEAKRLVALGSFATSIERFVRGFTARSLFWKLKYAVIDSQANARRTIARKEFLEKKQACIALECWMRCIYARRELERLQREAASIKLQSRWRSIQAVLMLAKCREAAVAIQKIARGSIQRPKYKQALKEAEEEARVNSKLAALQKRLKEAEMKWIQADKQRIAAEKRAEGVAGASDGAASTAPSTPTRSVTEEEEKKMESPTDQQALIHESNEMVEYFKQEMFKLKSANYLLRSDLAALREANQHLAEHNLSLEASHSALKQNVTKMSQSNMRLAVNNSEQKDTISKLKQELKMDKIRNNSEIKSLQEQLEDKDRQHENEMNRMRREMERLRKIIAKTPNKGPQKYERATFNRASGKGSLPRVSSTTDMSVTSTLASSEEEWGHDAFLERSSKQSGKDPANWTVVKKRERRPRKPRSAQGSRRYSGDGPRGSKSKTPNKKTTETTPKNYISPTNKPMPNSSLAAAATKITPTPSPANSRPNSRPPSRANSPAPAAGGRGSGGRRGSTGKGSKSFKSPSGNTPKRNLSQSSLGNKSTSKKDMRRTHSQGQMQNKK